MRVLCGEKEEEGGETAPRRPSQIQMFLNARLATFMVNMDAISDTESRVATFKHNIATIGGMITGQGNDDPVAEAGTTKNEASTTSTKSEEDKEEEKKEDEAAAN